MKPEPDAVRRTCPQSAFGNRGERYQRGVRDNFARGIRYGELPNLLACGQRCNQRLFGQLRARREARRLSAADGYDDIVRDTNRSVLILRLEDAGLQHRVVSLLQQCRFVKGVAVAQQSRARVLTSL